MTADSDRFRRRAKECRRLAEETDDDIIKRQLVEIAEALEADAEEDEAGA